MYPYLVRIGSVYLSSYGVAVALAFLVSVWLASRSVRGLVPSQATPTATQVVDCLCWAIMGGVIGGRLLYVLLNWEIYRATPQEIVAIWHGGLVWYGGFVGGLLGAWLFLKRHRLSFLQTADRIVPFVALGHAIGRIGCFANGCCYGKPTSKWFGVLFPGHPHPVIPTQLIESASLLVLYLILRGLQTSSLLKQPGGLFGLYLIGYAMIRFSLEFWRADQPIAWCGLTLHQLLSLALVAIGIWFALVKTRKRPLMG